MLLGFYLFLVITLPVAIAGLVAFNGLPRGRVCPLCADETLRVQSWRHTLVSRVLDEEDLHARWCPTCGWTGSARLPKPLPEPLVTGVEEPVNARAVGDDTGLEIRQVQIDGAPWQVRLQCWSEDGTWRGRLLFVDPGGRSWHDPQPCVSGSSALQVLSKALSYPDQALVGRIRRAGR